MNNRNKKIYKLLDALGPAIKPSSNAKDGLSVVDLVVNQESYCGYDLVSPSGARLPASPYHIRLWKQWKLAQAYARALRKRVYKNDCSTVDLPNDLIIVQVKDKSSLDNLLRYIEANCPGAIIVVPDRDFDDILFGDCKDEIE